MIACIHVACACVAVYWASPLILIFQVMIWTAKTTATIMIITISWDTAQTSRSVLMSSPTSAASHFFYAYFESLWGPFSRDSWDTLFGDLLWAPACAKLFWYSWFTNCLLYAVFIYMWVVCSLKQLLKVDSKSYFLELHFRCLSKINEEPLW